MTAVDDIDLKIRTGESVAYVGPNGAGKSTTIKLLTGILMSSEGETVGSSIGSWCGRYRPRCS